MKKLKEIFLVGKSKDLRHEMGNEAYYDMKKKLIEKGEIPDKPQNIARKEHRHKMIMDFHRAGKKYDWIADHIGVSYGLVKQVIRKNK